MANTQSSLEDGFAIDPSTKLTRACAQAVVFSDASVPDSCKASEIVHAQSRRERISSRIKKESKRLRERLEKNATKVNATKRAALSKARSRMRRGVRSKSFNESSCFVPTSVLVAEDADHPTEVEPSNEVPRDAARCMSTRSSEIGYGSRKASPASIARGTLVEPQSYRPWMDIQSPSLATSATIRVSDENADEAAIVDDLVGAISKQNAGEVSREIQALLDQCQQQAEAYAAMSQALALAKSTSISAQLTAFHFCTLVPMDILSRFAPTHRVLIKTSNCLTARRDMVQLSHIWSQLVGPAPISWDLELNDRMRKLETSDGERLCKFMEEGFHRCVSRALSVKTSVIHGEGAMGHDWWEDFEAKLQAAGSLNIEAISEQLTVVGPQYINVPALESAVRAIKALDVDAVSAMASDHDGWEASSEEQVIAHSPPVSERKANETATFSDPANQQVERHSVAATNTHSAALMRRWSTFEIPLPVASEMTGADDALPFRSLRLGNERPDSAMSLETEKVSRLGSSTTTFPSSVILKEVIATLDAAVAGKPESSPGPLRRRASQVPHPLTIRKSHQMISKHDAIKTWPLAPKRPQGIAEQIPPSFMRKNRKITVITPDDSRSNDVIYSGPPELSNKAKGKLPVARTTSTWTAVASSRPAGKSMERRT